jgi:hypothetical protein
MFASRLDTQLFPFMRDRKTNASIGFMKKQEGFMSLLPTNGREIAHNNRQSSGLG